MLLNLFMGLFLLNVQTKSNSAYTKRLPNYIEKKVKLKNNVNSRSFSAAILRDPAAIQLNDR